MHKRDFLRTIGGASLGVMFSPAVLARYAAMPYDRLAQDDTQASASLGMTQLESIYAQA